MNIEGIERLAKEGAAGGAEEALGFDRHLAAFEFQQVAGQSQTSCPPWKVDDLKVAKTGRRFVPG